jgi:hypothetical protein
MRVLGIGFIIGHAIIAEAQAMDARLADSLRQLDPATRFEQICAIEAMSRIDRDPSPFHPDRALIDAMADPIAKGDTLLGKGGAFRSGGHWYSFSFKCTTSADHLAVLSFEYRIGPSIPESQWNEHGLWK